MNINQQEREYKMIELVAVLIFSVCVVASCAVAISIVRSVAGVQSVTKAHKFNDKAAAQGWKSKEVRRHNSMY